MATKKYLDNDGLLYFWTKLKSYFVKQETGKGLSTNDFTDALKSNYNAAYSHSTSAHAPSDAEKNVLVGIKINGTDVPVDSATRKSAFDVPTKTSDLTNDSGFITSADVPEGSTASSVTPVMDGVAAKGTDNGFARGDHVHPSDTSKVDKVDGKGLSTNDYTTAEKNKLGGIDAGAEVNVVETIKVNGTALEVTSKAVNIEVPTNNNQLANGAGYQTSAQVESAITAKGYQTATQVNTAIEAKGYQTASQVDSAIEAKEYQTATQVNTAIEAKGYQTASQVATAIAAAPHLKRTKVTTLPDADDADENTIYMVPITSATGDNKFTEWMVIDEAWEKTGDSDVDLSGYVQDSDLSAITNGEIDTMMTS